MNTNETPLNKTWKDLVIDPIFIKQVEVVIEKSPTIEESLGSMVLEMQSHGIALSAFAAIQAAFVIAKLWDENKKLKEELNKLKDYPTLVE